MSGLLNNITKLCLEVTKGNVSIITEISYKENSPRFIVKKRIDSGCEGGGVVRSTTTVYYKSQFSSFYRENSSILNIEKYSSKEERDTCLILNEYLKSNLT